MFYIKTLFLFLLFICAGCLTAAPAYWIDTHVHIGDNTGLTKKFLKLADTYNIDGAIALNNFVAANKTDKAAKASLAKVIKKYKKTPTFYPCLDVSGNTADNMSGDFVEQITGLDTTNSILCFGEFAFYRGELEDAVLTGTQWQAIFEEAEIAGTYMMVHMRSVVQLSNELAPTLATYPDIVINLHGIEYNRTQDRDTLIALMQTYSNLFFTLDTATLVYSLGINGMYPENFDTTSTKNLIKEFISYFDANKAALIAANCEHWEPLVEAVPDQVMWGTDLSDNFHADKDVFSRLMELSEGFTACLTAAQQEAYAHGNAEALIEALSQ